MARRLMILGALLLVLAPSIGLPQAGPTPTPIYTGPPPPAPGWNNAGMSTFPSTPGTGWGSRSSVVRGRTVGPQRGREIRSHVDEFQHFFPVCFKSRS